MSVIHADYQDTYQCKTTDQPLIVTVVTGDGQIPAAVNIYLGTQQITANVLGTKSEVAGKTALIQASITGSVIETTWTSVTIYITEGENNTTFGPYKNQLPENFDTIICTLQLQLS